MTELEVGYCEGWDPATGQVVGPMPAAMARERDETGEQYAVALTEAGRPRALAEICWAYRSVVVWLFDEQLRRTSKRVYRRFDRLYLAESEEWHYPSAELGEFERPSAELETTAYSRNGELIRRVWRPGSRRGKGYSEAFDVNANYTDIPQFGAWAEFAGFTGLVTQAADPDPYAPLPPVQRPWRPPMPLQPVRLDELFEPGHRYLVGGTDEFVTEIDGYGPLRLTTGAVVVADPGVLWNGFEPLLPTVDPGAYPVQVSRSGNTVLGVKLVIRDEPVTQWEMALRQGESPEELGAGEFFGFGVDTGVGAFMDAAAADVMAEKAEDLGDEFEDGDVVDVVDVVDVGAPEGNMIAFRSGFGDGAYPVWIGRTGEGTVACFVADMLIIAGAESAPG